MSTAPGPATFGAWVRLRRRQLDLTQAELGKRAGCSEAAIRKIEADERQPSRQLAQLLAGALEIAESDQPAFLQAARGLLLDSLSPQPARKNPNNLPVLLTSTIDRAHELTAVMALFLEGQAHLVTLVGPPGIGKTRLSILCGNRLLESYPDGVWFVDLAEIDNPDFFISTLAHALSPLGLPPSAGLEQLASQLRDLHLLLILDNCEHVVEKAAMEVARLLKSCPQLHILATSRIPLRIYGEHEYPMPSLAVPPPAAARHPEALGQYEAVQLFVARARQRQPDFGITPQIAEAVVDICATLEGMPLALELAAASLQAMSLSEMSAALRRMEGGNWIRLFSTPARDLPARQRTLENVVAWSYALLTAAQRELFCKLAIFSGWFDAEAASAICFAGTQLSLAAVRQQLVELQEHSLLVRYERAGQLYWRMLEVIREYADLQLGGQRRLALETLRLEHYSQRLLALKREEDGPQEAFFFELHVANLHGALQWAIREQAGAAGLQLALLLDDYWSMHGYFREGLDLMRRLLALPAAYNPVLRADALGAASDLAWQQHDFETSLDFGRQAAELWRIYGMRSETAVYLHRVGRIYIEDGAYDQARQALSEALAQAQAQPDELNPGLPLAQIGELALFEGQLELAQERLQQALSYLPPGEAIFLAMAHTDLAEVALAQGDLPGAQRWLREACAPASQQIRRTLVFLAALAGCLAMTGEQPAQRQAARFYGAIEALAGRSGLSFSPFYHNLNGQRIAQLRQELSPAIWQAEFEAGKDWTREQALVQAQAVVDGFTL